MKINIEDTVRTEIEQLKEHEASNRILIHELLVRQEELRKLIFRLQLTVLFLSLAMIVEALKGLLG